MCRVLILKGKQGWLHGFGLFEHATIWAAGAGVGLWKVKSEADEKNSSVTNGELFVLVNSKCLMAGTVSWMQIYDSTTRAEEYTAVS